MSRIVHHHLNLVPLYANDLPFVQPVHDCICIGQVLWGLLAFRICDFYEAASGAYGFEIVDLISQSVEEVIL